ncbi:MAG TPA: glycosyltransferase [Ramlibacter sp.]|nr:glycosyltransferase [Ramlibacter sp.]
MSSAQPGGASCPVSIVIKALNEEARIGAAIESALTAVAPLGGEVVLADSCSSDRTVEIASTYPIRIVQLADPAERCCGVGPQLGFQHTLGEYVYLMDGDMKLAPRFLDQGLSFLAQHPEVAGVGGQLVEENMDHLEFRERALRGDQRKSGPVDRLDGGGLYRRRAIHEAGYLSDRNLHSYEEFDLAVRLRARGWKLWRMSATAVEHHGHDTPPYQLLLRRWRSGYICGAGELLRSAMGQPWMRLVLRDQRELRLYVGVLCWWALLLTTPFWPLDASSRALAFALMAAWPVAMMVARKRSIGRGVYAVVSWSFNAVGLLRGLLRRRRQPRAPIASRILREPEQEPTPPRSGTPPGASARRAPPSAHPS